MRKTIVFFLMYLLSACHVGQEYSAPSFLSDDQVKTALELKENSLSPTTDWYKIFNDDILNTLIQQALKNNFSIKQAKERLIQARYTYQINAKQMFPMINANGTYDFSKASSLMDYTYDTNYFKTGFDASWELDFWGKGNYLSAQYFELMKGATYSEANIKTSISAEIATNYVNLRKAQKQLNIAEHNLSLQQEILAIVEQKFKAGITDELALNQAKFTIENTKTSIPPLKVQIENYKNSLAVLLGVLPQNLPKGINGYAKNITSTPFKYNVQNLKKLPLNIIQSRPDVLYAESTLSAQNNVVNQAITSLYPTITLGATFGYISTSGKNLYSNNRQIYGYAPEFSIPIWHWNQLTNNIELQKHIREEELLNYNDVILTALAELKNAIYSVEQAYKTDIYTNDALKNMQNIFNLTKLKYQNGLIEFTDLASAEQNFLSAQTTLIDANASILQYLISFYKATGGGYNFKN
jgi:NodT family efflux transporter outer membrane factor (OMF) lipoprotein